MTEYRKGDVCSLEVEVVDVASDGDILINHKNANGNGVEEWVKPSDLTLLRRSPVDLATCDLSEPVDVVFGSDDFVGKLVARDGEWGLVRKPNNQCTSAKIASLLPLDAPAPESEVERLRKIATTARSWVRAARAAVASKANTDGVLDTLTKTMGILEEAIAATDPSGSFAFRDENGQVQRQSPTCPPNHIMIGDRAVPEPMRKEPTSGLVGLYVVSPVAPGGYIVTHWGGETWQREAIKNGLIHSTEANARAHAEAIIAMSARGDA